MFRMFIYKQYFCSGEYGRSFVEAFAVNPKEKKSEDHFWSSYFLAEGPSKYTYRYYGCLVSKLYETFIYPFTCLSKC